MDNKRNRFALDDFTIEDANELLEDNGYIDMNISDKRKMILGVLLYINGIDNKDNDGYFFVENEFICKLIGITKKTLLKALKYFISLGIISRISGKRGQASMYKIEDKYTHKYTHKDIDNQVVVENRNDKYTHKYTPDIDIEEDKDIDKEIEIKKDIDKNNIYNIINILNNIYNIIKEKNNKKEKEIEELNFKLEALIQKVDNKIKIENNMKENNNKINITPSQDALEMILAKLISIEARITSIEGQNCAVTALNTSSNIIIPIEEDNATEAKEMVSDATVTIPTEIVKEEFEEKSTKIEKRSVPTFVKCEVKLNDKVEKKDTESPRKTFRSDLTASNDVSGVIVPQVDNKPVEKKKMTDEEWEKFVNEVDSKSAKKSNITRDVMGSFVPCADSSEGWNNGKKQFTSMSGIDKEIEEWKRKGLDIMQIATRFKVDKDTFTMTDKLYTPSKVSNQIDVEVKKEENITPSEVKEEVDKVTEILAKVNKDTGKEVVEEVHKNTEENVYYAETNTATFERENDDFTSTEEALDNIFASDYDEEVTPTSKLKEEMDKRLKSQSKLI